MRLLLGCDFYSDKYGTCHNYAHVITSVLTFTSADAPKLDRPIPTVGFDHKVSALLVCGECVRGISDPDRGGAVWLQLPLSLLTREHGQRVVRVIWVHRKVAHHLQGEEYAMTDIDTVSLDQEPHLKTSLHQNTPAIQNSTSDTKSILLNLYVLFLLPAWS